MSEKKPRRVKIFIIELVVLAIFIMSIAALDIHKMFGMIGQTPEVLASNDISNDTQTNQTVEIVKILPTDDPVENEQKKLSKIKTKLDRENEENSIQPVKTENTPVGTQKETEKVDESGSVEETEKVDESTPVEETEDNDIPIENPAGEASIIKDGMKEITGTERDELDEKIWANTVKVRDGRWAPTDAFKCNYDFKQILKELMGRDSRWMQKGSLKLYQDENGNKVCSFMFRNWRGENVAYVECNLTASSKPEVANIVKL